MLNTLRKLNQLPKDGFFIDLSSAGNTKPSSVPIGLVKSLRAGRIHKDMTVMVAGFRIGLSWAETYWISSGLRLDISLISVQ